MPETSAHPSREQLNAFNLGQLPPDEAVAIESHISRCEPCCDTIISLSSDDTFVGLLKEAKHLSTDLTVDHGLPSASSSDQEVPAQLAEHPRYEILTLIGKGGMGDVYKARHRKMERTVALKVINRELVRKAEAIDRFHREVKAAAQLSHPNIVTAYDADQADDFHFMVMEYVDGVDLSQTVKARGALPVAEACDYVQQAAIGLQHAHERGMVHRDIKPHNLMVTKDGTVKILDFGLASLAPEALLDSDAVEARGDLTAAGAIMGTPDFISPEQAEDARKADIRSDIYSLGATLYFLLSGRMPFVEGSVTHKLKSHASVEPDSLESLRDDVPAELVAIVSRMMAKDPSDRFQTPAEVVEALQTLGKETEPTKSRKPVHEVQPRRRRIGWLPLIAIATSFLAMIFAGVVYYIETNHGIVRVEVVDDSLAVEISGQTITVGNGNREPLEIHAGDCVLKVRRGDFQFETEGFQVRRGEKVAFKVEMLDGEIVVRKDGERFQSKALSDDIEVRQILDWMEKAYAECKSYRDSGVIKLVTFWDTASRDATVEYSFTTAFVRPDRFQFDIKTEDNRLLISANGRDIQTWWDVEPGIKKPESLDFAMAQATGFSGGDVARIPALLMPQKLELSGGLDLIDPKKIEDGKLQNNDCFRLEYNFRDEQFTLWIDKQSYLIRRIDERIKFDNIRIERTTTFDPTIDGKITDEMLKFDPPAPRAADDRVQTLPESVAASNDSATRAAQERDSDAVTHQAGQQRSDNQLEMPLCWCPAGEFKLGRKQRPVALPHGFWMGKHEVTQAQYEALMGDNPSENKGESLPVEAVKWNEAKKFCQKFTELERKAGRLPKGWEYRLPTEAQWEYACRAGTTLVWDDEKALVYPSTFGDDLSGLGDYAWYSENSDGTQHPVGQKKPNAWGLCDMHGNVREWVRDAWQSKLAGGKDPEVDLGSPIHARRGGDWLTYAEPCASPFIRGFVVAGREEPHMTGFRLALVSVDGSGDGVAADGKDGTDDDVDNRDSANRSGPAGTSKAADRNEEDNATETEAESAASTKRKTTGFLVEAVKRGDRNAVEAALNAGVDPNGPANRLTALHWAVAQRISDGKTIEPTPQIAERLIEAGADVNAADYLGQTPLEWAAKYAPPEIVAMLIKAGADVDAESRYGTVLLAATTKLQEHGVENAKLLIDAGADVNAGQITTPLAGAVQVGNVEMIRLLINKGAAVNDEKNPAIHWAGTPEVAKVLLDAGADVKSRNRNGETALHRPLGPWHGPDAATLKLLVEAGADVNAKSNSGSTPLHAAVQQAKPEVAKLLVAAGADVDAKDKQGNTPLSLAHQALSWARGQQQVDNRPYEVAVQVLLDAGAKDDGRTELQRAVADGDLEQVKELIADAVDVNETGPQRLTAVHLASENGHAEILAALMEAGAKFDQTDEQRMRPLHLAANAGIARMLIAEGATVDSPMPSPLYMATMAGRSDVVRELIRADATVQDSHVAEMLNWATFAGQLEVVKVLFEQREANTLLNARSVYSPLHVAASGTFGDMNSPEDVTPEQRLNIAKLLVQKGADIDARWGANVNPQSGAAHMIDTTPLMFASSQGDVEMVKFLIDRQADVKATNASGQTALHFAAQHGHRSVVELLLNANADVNALTREAKTPLDVTQDAAVQVLLIRKDGKTASELLKESEG
jgi:serine/threonine protein kinase/ankyrin repeat protein/formylglycine-generating enzyme required for sulfatase activity